MSTRRGAAAAKARKRATDDYDDDGFVVEDEGAPKLKKPKTAGNTRAKKETNTAKQRDGEGNDFWEISAQRRVTVSQFKGKSLVSIREYYEKDGKQLPGKKGISLTVEQYSALMAILPDIEAVLVTKDETVARPNFDGGTGGPVADETEDDADEQKNREATSDEDGE